MPPVPKDNPVSYGRTMRSRPGYFLFWFPMLALCAVVTGCFVVMWAHAPKIPSHGMEALIGLPYAVMSLAMAPFLIGFGLLLWKRPRGWHPRTAVPTVVVTLGLVTAGFLLPRPGDQIQTFPMVFVDRNGNPVSSLEATITRSAPGFDMLKGRTERFDETVSIPANAFTLTKKKGMEAGICLEKAGYYHTSVTIPHVHPASRKTGLQKIGLGWFKDWVRTRWGVDGCTGAMNWPLEGGEPFRVVMLELSEPAVSPIPEYTEEDSRELQNSWKAK